MFQETCRHINFLKYAVNVVLTFWLASYFNNSANNVKDNIFVAIKSCNYHLLNNFVAFSNFGHSAFKRFFETRYVLIYVIRGTSAF